jgi:hypothetical protein
MKFFKYNLKTIDGCEFFFLSFYNYNFCSSVDSWVGVQKPVVTYDPGKLSVTNCAGLPNCLDLCYNGNNFYSQILHFHLSTIISKYYLNFISKNIWQFSKQI